MPQTTVTVCEDIPPAELSEFLLWVERVTGEIPEEYRDQARVEISAGMHYEQEYPTCVVSYTRPETKLEANQREAQDRRNARSRELYERSQYEALKAKFDPDPPATTAGISLKKP